MLRAGWNWRVMAPLALLLITAGTAADRWIGPPRVEASSPRVGTAASGPAEKPAEARIRWLTSYAAAEAEARKTGRPLLVEFYADWCPPCQLMERTTFQDRGVVEATRRFVPVRIDVDRDQATAERFRVSGIPQAFVVAPTGKVLAQTEGYADAAQFSAFMRQGLSKAGK